MLNVSESFRDAIQSAGLIPPDVIESDGKIHRFSSNGKRGDDAGWYVLHDDGIPAGSFGDWRTDISQSWCADIGRSLTTAEAAEHRAKVEAMKREREESIAHDQAEAAMKAKAIWGAAKPAHDDHAYLAGKGIKASGARLYNDALVIPLSSGGEVQSLQFISPEGDKRFLTGGSVSGCYFSIGNQNGAEALCIAEGFATGASIHDATCYPVAVAFNAGNLLAVAKVMQEKFPDMRLILCADDDWHTEGNPGIRKATEAALSVGGLLAVPVFGSDRPDDVTDFNDMAALHGLEAVKQAIANATTPVMGEYHAGGESAPAGDPDGWPEPHPLAVKVESEPYPIDALPDTIRAAVEEVAGFVKAPVAMVVSSALAALSLAAQAHIDAKRADRLQGPVSLFLLTIADSGERKSTCDGFFVSAIREYQEEQTEAMKPAIMEYQAAFAAWEAERDGILSAIKGAGKSGKATDKLKGDLAELQRDQPEPPRVPRLLFADITPEALGYQLAKGWPAAGIVSSEAGAVFGSHGMGKDSAMRNLALLNQLWDGATVSSERRTVESWTARGARLTVALQVQEPTLREFFNRSGGLARGTGFLARFLVAWPESTQGFRPFTEAPPNWPHLAAFHKRIAAILANPVPMDEEGALSPALMMLAPEAKAAWVEFHDAIESELASGGELYDVRDVASKSADNAARLGALFQIFEHGMGGAVGLDCFESASLIAAWHLNESRRFFGELALPAELADAARLDSWLIQHCQRGRTHLVPTREAQRYGPVRDKEKLATALRELEELDRVRVSQEGRRKTIKVNPALIGGAV
jgi:putative DNA primase/helicase